MANCKSSRVRPPYKTRSRRSAPRSAFVPLNGSLPNAQSTCRCTPTRRPGLNRTGFFEGSVM